VWNTELHTLRIPRAEFRVPDRSLPVERIALMFQSRCVAAAVLMALASGIVQAEDARTEKAWVFIGTYTGPKSKGIYRCEIDLATGKLSAAEVAAEAVNPSFLAIHPTKKFLYCVDEISNFGKKPAGGVSAFALDPATGKLTALNQQSSVGTGPCHLTVDRTGKNVLVANYGGGSVAVLPIGEDGKLGEASDFHQHKGSSVNKDRQKEPHAHSINIDATNRFAVAADLGLDQLLVYKFDAAKGKLTPNDPAFVAIDPGSGPRHFAFHPTAPYGYAINEMANTVTALGWDKEKGVFKKVQTISTLPDDFKGKSYTAEVVVHPSGKFLYGSNRGHNSIAAFSIDEKTGELKRISIQGKGIKTPRNFAIDPTGKFLLVANQDGASVLVFAIDQKTGELTPTEHKVEVQSPVCVRFVTAP
jgi:6-phosphogluconolactonase